MVCKNVSLRVGEREREEEQERSRMRGIAGDPDESSHPAPAREVIIMVVERSVEEERAERREIEVI
jgi:hypothetical protein